MLVPAQRYRDILESKLLRTWYNPKYMYYDGSTGSSLPDFEDDNYERHSFVSVMDSWCVVGYFAYHIDWESMSADDFNLIGFDECNSVLVGDVYKHIFTIFEEYHLNRIEWQCIVGNPVLKTYRHFIAKHGGRECGYHRQARKLMDGQLHDVVDFEILASEFHR